MATKRAKKTAKNVEVYTVPKEKVEKKASQGYIEHKWYKLLLATVIAAIVAALFFWRKKE